MILPLDQQVSVARLASVFNSTTATYKFYWFLSILESVEAGKTEVDKKELFARMICLSWYTIHYFHVSFGKHDLLQEASREVKTLLGIEVDDRKETILQRILRSEDAGVSRRLGHFDGNVPHKFLSPWLGSGLRGDVYRLSQEGRDNPPYSLFEGHIAIRPNWFGYLSRNASILKNFCYWNLALFLQTRNPNVPDIPSKLIRPVQRKPLTPQRRGFWDLVISEKGPLECLYTGRPLGIGDYDVDHFIPFQFVAHDLMWNLVPADPAFNSIKGDRLPVFDRHFDAFYEMQSHAFETVRKVDPRNRFLEDYLSVFPDMVVDRNRMQDTIVPILSIAHNNGFQYMN